MIRELEQEDLVLLGLQSFALKDGAKPPISADTFGSNGGNDSETSGPETPVKEVVDNGIKSEVAAGLSEEFQEGDMVDALSRVEQKSLENWKEDRGITIWDPKIKIFLDNTLRTKWFLKVWRVLRQCCKRTPEVQARGFEGCDEFFMVVQAVT
nr:hypothetical protein [Tanacetum cinerariifolium]